MGKATHTEWSCLVGLATNKSGGVITHLQSPYVTQQIPPFNFLGPTMKLWRLDSQNSKYGQWIESVWIFPELQNDYYSQKWQSFEGLKKKVPTKLQCFSYSFEYIQSLAH